MRVLILNPATALTHSPPISAAPRLLGAISSKPTAGIRITLLLAITAIGLSFAWADPLDFGYHGFISVNALSQPMFRANTFASPHGCAAGNTYSSACTQDSIADIYGGDWFGLRIPLDNGLAYEQLPGMLTLTLSANMDSVFEFKTVLPLRRDFNAWYTDPVGASWFTQASELDINQPEEGFFNWNNTLGFLKMGRFKPDLGPSPNSVVLGSAVPYHDAIWWHVAMGHFRFDWILSSLNASLMGTPDSAGGEAPVGSEAWQQSHYTVSNARGRVYDSPDKNLVLRRLGWDIRWGWLAITEQLLVGGKALDARDIDPFEVWHNEYGDGYSKSSMSAELGVRPWKGGQFYGQLDYEAIGSPVGENSTSVTPTTYAYLMGWKQDWRKDSTQTLWSRLDYVYTDPAFNNYHLPLLRMTSRILYRSNFRSQDEPNFSDSYFVDYPLGYRRGPDASDLWFDMGYESLRHRCGGTLELAYLRRGSQNLASLWDSAAQYSSAPSGIVETDKRVWSSGWFKPWQHDLWNLVLNAGLGVRYLENENNVEGANGWDLGWSTGISFNVGH